MSHIDELPWLRRELHEACDRMTARFERIDSDRLGVVGCGLDRATHRRVHRQECVAQKELPLADFLDRPFYNLEMLCSGNALRSRP